MDASVYLVKGSVMNKLILAICVMAVSTVKAQIMSGGLLRNQILQSEQGNISSQGIELSSTHYFFSVNLGAGAGSNNTTKISTRHLALDFTPTGFHHAYLTHQLAPFVGFQVTGNNVSKTEKGLNELASTVDSKNTQYALNLGMKYSNNRFICSGAYSIGQNERAVVIKLAYVFAVTHKCLKKRMRSLDMGF